jgi:hypothetical protein
VNVNISKGAFWERTLPFIKIAPENPVLWTGLKGASAKSRKNLNQMLKRVQHDNRVRVSFFCHPELVSGSRFLVLRIWVLKPRPVGGVLYFLFFKTA